MVDQHNNPQSPQDTQAHSTTPPPLKACVVLLSGGLDSTTILAIAKAAGYTCYALSFSYGQRQTIELHAARQIATQFGAVAHRIDHLDLASLGGSALTDHSIPVPKDRSHDTISQSRIPITYVPARNTIFLSHAMAWAEVLGATEIFIGVTAVDYSGYPDCRPAFIDAFERMANAATGHESAQPPVWRIHAPLMHWSKAQIIQHGMSLGVDYSMTHSCYDPIGDRACGRCDACSLRRQGFANAGVADPTRYA